ncbi:MAG TPA: DUF4129 domain-containing protein [Actinotalea sp.]
MDRATTTGTVGASGDDREIRASGAAARRGAVVVLLTVVAVLAGALAGPWHPVLRGSPLPAVTAGAGAVSPRPTPSPDPFAEMLKSLDVKPWDLSLLGQVMSGCIVLGLIYLAARWWRRRPRPRQEGLPDGHDVLVGEAILGSKPGTPDLPALEEGLAGAGEHLRSNQLPTDAVIAAWVALEDGAERSGIVRDPASTPTEFTVDVLDRTPVDPAATRTLLDLYLRARFGDEPMAVADVAAATAAVQSLAATLARLRDEELARGDGEARDDKQPHDDEQARESEEPT